MQTDKLLQRALILIRSVHEVSSDDIIDLAKSVQNVGQVYAHVGQVEKAELLFFSASVALVTMS